MYMYGRLSASASTRVSRDLHRLDRESLGALRERELAQKQNKMVAPLRNGSAYACSRWRLSSAARQAVNHASTIP